MRMWVSKNKNKVCYIFSIIHRVKKINWTIEWNFKTPRKHISIVTYVDDQKYLTLGQVLINDTQDTLQEVQGCVSVTKGCVLNEEAGCELAGLSSFISSPRGNKSPHFKLCGSSPKVM